MAGVKVGFALITAAILASVAIYTSIPSPSELVANPYGAYSTNFESKDPLSLGFSPSEYLNSPNAVVSQEPVSPWTQYQQRQAQQLQDEHELEKEDEQMMVNQEEVRGAQATAAIRADLERSKLLALRREKKDGLLDKASLDFHAQKERAEPSFTSAAQVREAILKRRAQIRLENEKKLSQTYEELAQAVGSPPLHIKKAHSARHRDVNPGREAEDAFFRDDDERKAQRSERERDTRLSQDRHHHRVESSMLSMTNGGNRDRKTRLIKNPQHTSELAEQERKQLLAQVKQEKRKQSLAAVVKEAHLEDIDTKNQWKSFTSDLGLGEKHVSVPEDARRQVDEFIDNDLK